jgi:hypothetical protein
MLLWKAFDERAERWWARRAPRSRENQSAACLPSCDLSAPSSYKVRQAYTHTGTTCMRPTLTFVFASGKDLVTWQLHLEYYLKGAGQSQAGAGSDARRSWAGTVSGRDDLFSSSSKTVSASSRASFLAKAKQRTAATLLFPRLRSYN